MDMIVISGWVVVCFILMLIIFPLINIIHEKRYTQRLMEHMSSSLGRELTQREKDQIIFRYKAMYRPYWIDALEESLRKGVTFVMPPLPTFDGKIKENLKEGNLKRYSLITGEELPVKENDYQKIIDEEIEKKAEENDNIRRYMNRSKMAGEKRKCLINPKDLF